MGLVFFHKKVFGELVNGFTRYHEKDITCIRFHVYGEKGKLTKGVIDYNANGLCLGCSGNIMSCGIDTLIVNNKPFDQKRIAKCSEDVLKKKFFWACAD